MFELLMLLLKNFVDFLLEFEIDKNNKLQECKVFIEENKKLSGNELSNKEKKVILLNVAYGVAFITNTGFVFGLIYNNNINDPEMLFPLIYNLIFYYYMKRLYKILTEKDESENNKPIEEKPESDIADIELP